jgi:cysteine desulfurase / selenocysteine lyase
MEIKTLEISTIKKQFPIFANKDLIYFDTAATAQKPQCVIDAMQSFLQEDYATVHRGIYDLSMEATTRYDLAREKVASFINACQKEEIVFTKGTTDSINIVALSLAKKLQPEDEVIITEAEHHANLIPWQMLKESKKIVLKIAPITDQGEIDLQKYQALLSPKTKIVSVAHIYNALGSINPVQTITQMAHDVGAIVLIDGAQAVSHMTVDVQKIGCDLYAFSSHKAYGPTGIGVLYGRYELLQEMEPVQGGGDMIDQVTLEKSTYQMPPLRFEAGTPPIMEAIGLARALTFIEEIGLDAIESHERSLKEYLEEKLLCIKGLTLLGKSQNKAAIVTFKIEGVHPLDLATMLNLHHIAIRTGHMCAQTALKRFNVTSACRISFGIYNTIHEIDLFIHALEKVLKDIL